jgi:peptidyl-prolyl cis-trans isomerase SurA
MKSPSALTLVLAAILLHVSSLQAQLASASPARPARLRQPAGPIEVNGIAAKVNGRVITRNEVFFMLAPIHAQLTAQFPRRGAEFESQYKVARDGVIQELIDRQIILDEFKQIQKDKGAGIKDYVIDEEINRQVRELFNGDEAKFHQELKRSRLTMDGYRKSTKEKMIVQAMRANQFSDAPPPLPNEIQKEYDEIKVSRRDTAKDLISFKKIFIPKMDQESPLATPETQLTLAEDLAKQISHGADFTELAKIHSRDAFAGQGGIQENVSRRDLSPAFAAIIFDAKINQLVGPLEDEDNKGFTLVIPTKIQLGPPPPLDGKVREMIEELVRRKKTHAQYERWIQTRRKRAMIDIKM